MDYKCDICGCVYEWEMYYNNHLRNRHGIRIKRKRTIRLKKQQREFLDNYFTCDCDKPSLEDVDKLSALLNIKKETVYWWFANRIRKNRKNELGTL